MTRKIAIVGAGGMGAALAQGLLKAKYAVSVCDRNQPKLERLKSIGASVSQDLNTSLRDCSIILGCVKPHVTLDMMREIADQDAIFVSCAAGLESETLLSAYSGPIVRAMPNVGAAHAASMTALFACGEKAQSTEVTTAVTAVFEATGSAIWLKAEKDFYAATAISGSGPAFVLVALEAMEDAGVEAGLSRTMARAFAKGAVQVAALSVDEHTHPAQVRAQITSPGGITIKGLAALERSGGRAAFSDAISAAIDKTIKMA